MRELPEVIDEMRRLADTIAATRLPDPGTLRHNSDRRRNRSRVIIAALAVCAAMTTIPMLQTVRHSSAEPVTPPAGGCVDHTAAADAPSRWSNGRPADPGWQRVRPPLVSRTDYIQYRAVASNSHGYLLVGVAQPSEEGPIPVPLVWFSTDGRSWRVVGQGTFADAATISDNLVLAGAEWPSNADGVVYADDPASWQSWTRAAVSTWHGLAKPFENARGVTLTGLSCTAGGLTAFGADRNTPLSWTSRDGVHWMADSPPRDQPDPSAGQLGSSWTAVGPAGAIAVNPTTRRSVWFAAEGD